MESVPEVTEGQSFSLSFDYYLLTFFLKTVQLYVSFSAFSYLSVSSSPEWIAFQEAEYKFFDHRTTWDQAQRICSWFDSSLASVHSAEEQAFLANTLRKVQKVFMLIVKRSSNPKNSVEYSTIPKLSAKSVKTQVIMVPTYSTSCWISSFNPCTAGVHRNMVCSLHVYTIL